MDRYCSFRGSLIKRCIENNKTTIYVNTRVQRDRCPVHCYNIWTGESHTISYSPVRAADITSHATNGGDNNIIVAEVQNARRKGSCRVRCKTAAAFLARCLIRGRTTTSRRITKQHPTCTIYFILFIFIYIYICTYGQVNRLVSFLPLVAYIHQRRHPSAVHTRQRSRPPYTHTQIAHNIIYTPGTMSTICETPFRPGPDTTIENG